MSMRSVRVSEGISWVGAIDWNLRDFHGYETPRGTTYNAYLVQGAEKTALVDTVKEPLVDELLARVSDLIDPAKVDLIVVNHVEPDHNGGLRRVMEAMPQARVVASRAGVAGVADYHDGLAIEAVGPDDVIDLGGKTLRFLPMPMVHWPDSMFTYVAESATLLPNDAFGQHLATSERFADEVGCDLALEELAIYYANILMPLGPQVAKAVEKVLAKEWKIEVVAPSHGVIWRGEALGYALDAYSRLTSGRVENRFVVAFSTMWGSTSALAARIADALAAEGVGVDVFDLASTPKAHITHVLHSARGLLLGSPTMHHGMLHNVAGYLQYLAGLKPVGKVAGTFGSYGWSPGACKQMEERLAAMGFELPFEPFTVKYSPNDADFDAAGKWAARFASGVAPSQ
ncbi:MAG: FprA family A-type flavoprotein [Actinobacteria bacterium]|nr:FprA family A-type flavoprotein [Actinomycetota bacterium]